VKHPGAWADVGTPRVRRIDPPCDVGKFSCLSNLFSEFPILPRSVSHIRLLRGRPSRRQVGGERA
jgi:hypothetical protein